MSTAVSHFWWEEIPGPRHVRTEICEALKSAKSVVLTGPVISWPKELRSLVSKEFQVEFGIYSEEISSSESSNNPSMYLLNKFGKPEDVHNYREGIDPPLPEYLKKTNAIERKLVYVPGISKNEFNSWGEFLKRYKPKSFNDGIFMVETSAPVEDIATSGRITIIDVSSRFSFYDVLSFAMLLASSLNYTEIWKHYAAWVAALIYEKDIETLADFLVKFLPGIVQGDIHTAIMQRTTDQQYTRQSIWKTQFQIVFPLIENARTSIISKYIKPIKDALASGEHIYCGRRILDPLDSEFGFLAYLGSLNDSANGHLFPYDIYQDICFLHECRNKLAHLEFCDIQEIDQIININIRLGK